MPRSKVQGGKVQINRNAYRMALEKRPSYPPHVIFPNACFHAAGLGLTETAFSVTVDMGQI
ncbi:hypothetical protein ABENE_15570 [Asticcacaulis benevestitus DSM 16100 = ATCC BAA-896]|uniref:Uncharacterized protein n=1 Tax=Asticcacaulis benevestitus DSM 16100 = ATCC BAA-896 TaxID=1121022 RepID=V4PN10_9CAUL|nr:hypothetical protein ABENE_15570 [Asticcacaulis benevestitus DSM 16100 = ATCC BAA-896]